MPGCGGGAGPAPRSRIDLLFLPLDDAAYSAAAIGFLERLRASPATARLPVVVTGRWPDPGRRLALLRAGADEVAEAPMQVALLQARIRNLMRARDTEGELSRRAATYQARGFSEAAVGVHAPAEGRRHFAPSR